MTREIRNARITKTFLGIEDHGILTAVVHLDYGSSGQGFGTYDLRGPQCAGFIEGVLEIAGVSKWEDLPGRYVVADYDSGKVYRIGHILGDGWFDPSELFSRDD